MNTIKDIHVIIITNKKQIVIFSVVFILIITGMILYINYRPGFMKIKPIPAQLADLKGEMKDGFSKIFDWQNKQDSINNASNLILQHLPTFYPLASNNLNRISSKYGVRINPITGDTVWHKGLDIVAKEGTLVYASASGRVVKAKRESGYGNMIEIDSGNGITTRFGHLNSMYVENKEVVFQGEVIGTVGNTGMSTGSHLHYEILNKDKNLNPLIFQ